jgi:DNA ligase 1
MDYQVLANAYEELESNSKRLKKTKIISNLLKQTDTENINQVILLLRGSVFSLNDSTELGISNRLLLKAISLVTGFEITKLEDMWRETGDLGIVTQNLFLKKKQATLFSETLSVSKVFETLKKLALTEGKGSTDNKIKLVSNLLSSASAIESKYIVRTVLQDLRVGVAESTIRDAIAWTYLVDPNYDDEAQSINPDREKYNEIIQILQLAIDKTNDYALVASLAKQSIDKLIELKIMIGKPIKVMLAQKSSLTEALNTVGSPAAFEYKLDGFRMQIQKQDDDVRIFTRRLDEVTAQFPDVVEVIKTNVLAKTCILDCEAVGFNPTTLNYTPFQNISQRIKRKYDVEKLALTLPIEINVFDILYLEGVELLKEPFEVRRQKISEIIKEETRKIVLIKQIVTENQNEIDLFFDESLKLGNEGIMAKNLTAPYKPGSRVGSMVKIKPHMDELDLVIVKAEWGTGKRNGWLTSFTVACQEDGEYLEIGKVGTGLKEKREEGLSFDELTELLKPIITKQTGRDVEVSPKIIVALRFEEIQKSPSYSSGYALRFPRIVALRDDKSLDEIATQLDIEEAFKLQGK